MGSFFSVSLVCLCRRIRIRRFIPLTRGRFPSAPLIGRVTHQDSPTFTWADLSVLVVQGLESLYVQTSCPHLGWFSFAVEAGPWLIVIFDWIENTIQQKKEHAGRRCYDAEPIFCLPATHPRPKPPKHPPGMSGLKFLFLDWFFSHSP